MTPSEKQVKNWARANRLAELANIKPGQARNFLSRNKNKGYEKLLDAGTDTRNPACKEMVKHAMKDSGKTRSPKPSRPSAGDPSRPARAGAPNTSTNINIEQALKLKHLTNEFGGVQNLQQAIHTLQELEVI